MSDLGHYDNHPAYRYQGLFVSKAFKFGRDRTSVPNIEAEIGRDGPWFTDDPAGNIVLVDEGVNPIGAIFEPLIDEVFGAGLLESDLDKTSFNAVRGSLGSVGFKISINQSETTDLRSYLATVLEYFDGFLVRKGTTIAAGYWKTGDINTAVLPIIGSDHLTAEPRLKSSGYDDCFTEVNVLFKDRAHFYHDAVASLRNPGLRQLLGEYRPASVQRPFIIDAAMANNYATQYLQRFARPGYSGEIEVKLERVEAIEDLAGMPIVGQLVKVDIASIQEEVVLRVLECEYPADEGPFTCTLTVELERSIWPELFIQPPPDRIGNFFVDIPAIVNFALWELPSGLKTGSGIQISVLAQRPAKSIVGFHVWTSLDNVIYEVINPPCTFAAYGQIVDETYPITRDTIDTTLGMHIKLFGVDLVPTQTDSQRDDYNWIAFVGVPGVDQFCEILSVGLVTSLGAGKYKVFTRSALYGTAKHSHGINTKVFFIQRDQLAMLSNKNFIKDATLWFGLQPFDNRQDLDLAAVNAFQHSFSGGQVGVPTLNNPTSDFVITTERTVNSRITATWTYILDQDIIGFNVRARRVTFDAQWITHNVGIVTSDIFQHLEPNKLYEVQIQALSRTDASDWSLSKQITTDAPNVPGVPALFSIIDGVQAATLKWTNATSSGIRGTQILFSEVAPDDVHLQLLDEVKLDQESYTRQLPYAASFVFFAVRHVNTLGVEGARTTGLVAHPLVETTATKLPTPFIAKATGEAGSAGEADYRLQLVNTSANQDADLKFSYNKTTWTLYSETGNYRDGLTGSVLPTSNIGAISLSAGGQLFARQEQDGFLTSDVTSFYNNTSKTPHGDGTGGGDGTPGKNIP